MGLLVTPANERLQVGTSSSAEMKLKMEIGFLKRHKVDESDGLPSLFFKDGGGVVTSELAKILESVWSKEQISKDGSELVIAPIFDGSSCENQRGISSGQRFI